MKKIFLFLIICIKLNAQSLPPLDNSFYVGSGFSGSISYPATVGAVKLQNDNKIIIGGKDLVTLNGSSINRNLLRINNNGTLDIVFSTNSNLFTKINTIDVQQDGKIIVGGNASANYLRINRFLSDGTIDPTFSNAPLSTDGFNSTITKIKVQSDGKILIQQFIAEGKLIGVSCELYNM